MTEIISISLENEMDLVLAHKRSMNVAQKIGLTVATQTAFATAVSEAARTIIDHTQLGSLMIGIDGKHPRFSLTANIVFDNDCGLSEENDGFYYAQKLVPGFTYTKSGGTSLIQMSISLPRSLKVDKIATLALKEFFDVQAPLNAYEEIKKRNNKLNVIAIQQEEEIKHAKLIDEKKSEFISIASHEIKTPITILKAYTQMLKGLKESCDPKVNAIVEKLDQQTVKLSVLAQQLMDVSQIENGNLAYNFEAVSFNTFIQDVVDVLRYVHNNHTIHLHIETDVVFQMDKLRLEQVITNLMGNAAKYSPKHTEISLTCKIDDQQILISVTDQGIGMSANSLEQIFKKFYRNSEVLNSHPGLGMGLYITSKIVIDHGGKIWATSLPNQGSTFYVSLPIVQQN